MGKTNYGMLDKIQIHYNPNGDARTLDHMPDYDEVHDAVETHRENMKAVFQSISRFAMDRAVKHDDSVVENFDDYYVATVAHLNGENPFTESLWYKEHFEDEAYRRYRTDSSEANLFDLIEAICDHAVVKNEKGSDGRIPIDKDQLYKIYLNTINQISDSIEMIL